MSEIERTLEDLQFILEDMKAYPLGDPHSAPVAAAIDLIKSLVAENAELVAENELLREHRMSEEIEKGLREKEAARG